MALNFDDAITYVFSTSENPFCSAKYILIWTRPRSESKTTMSVVLDSCCTNFRNCHRSCAPQSNSSRSLEPQKRNNNNNNNNNITITTASAIKTYRWMALENVKHSPCITIQDRLIRRLSKVCWVVESCFNVCCCDLMLCFQFFKALKKSVDKIWVF